jgi:hypothetical protein
MEKDILSQMKNIDEDTLKAIRSIGHDAISETINEYSLIKNLWSFTDEVFALIVDPSDRQFERLQNIRTCESLWGIIHEESNTIELLIPVVSNQSQEYSFNLKFPFIDNLTITMKTEDLSTQFRALLHCFAPWPIPFTQPGGRTDFYQRYLTCFNFLHREIEQKTQISKSYKMNGVRLKFDKEFDLRNTEEVNRRLKQLNFALKYANAEAPNIAVEDAKADTRSEINIDENRPITKKQADIFVPSYNDQLVDQFLKAEYEYGNRHKYILYYNVLEYLLGWASELSVIKKINSVITEPTSRIDQSALARKVFNLVKPIAKRDKDSALMLNLISEVVTPDDMWKVIENNKDIFSDSSKFEGNVRIIDVNAKKKIMENIAEALVHIRNRIVHFGDQSILFTDENDAKLECWVCLIRYLAKKAIHMFQSPNLPS